MKITNDLKTGIIGGIVASAIFIYFIQPIFDFTAKGFIGFSHLIGSAYVDRIYAQAAHLETQNFAFLTWGLLLVVFSLPSLGFGIRILLQSDRDNINEEQLIIERIGSSNEKN